MLVERADAGGRRTAAGVCPRTARKWVGGSGPRASKACRIAPRDRTVCAEPTPPTIVEQVEALRRQRWPASRSPPSWASRRPPSAASSGASASIASGPSEPAEPVRRYEREHPGELIHIDIKKLGRFESGRPSHHRRSAAARPDGRSAAAAAGSTSTSASTMPRASPSPRSCPTRGRRAPSPSSRPPSPTTPASASPSRGS